MAIEFYDVKTRQKVSVEEKDVKKIVYHPKQSGGSPRYALRGSYDGRALTKFVSKDNYDKLNVPEEKS